MGNGGAVRIVLNGNFEIEGLGSLFYSFKKEEVLIASSQFLCYNLVDILNIFLTLAVFGKGFIF